MSENNETKGTGFVAVHHYSDLYRGKHARVFSNDKHGKNYMATAKEFAETHTPITEAHKMKVAIEKITDRDARRLEEENAAKENDRMMRVYRSKGWVDKRGNVRAPKILIPEDFDL